MTSIKLAPDRAATDSLKHALAFVIAYGIVYVFVEWLFPQIPEKMKFSTLPVLFWIGIGIISGQMTQGLNRLFIYTMFAFYLVGNLNSGASLYRYGSFYSTNLQDANYIYSIFAIFLTIGIYFGDKLIDQAKITPFLKIRKEQKNTIFFIGCMLFPFIWFADEIYTLRRIPILTGESILDEMYSGNYGRLYGYGVLLTISALLAWSKLMDTKNILAKSSLTFILLATIFFMIFDGRRVFALVFLFSLLAFEISRNPDKSIWRKTIPFAVVLAALYLVVLYFRQGGMFATSSSLGVKFSQIGVEYRDFALLVTKLNPGSLTGYHWLGSALGGFANWLLLAIVGLNKNELVFGGSAYQIALEFRSNFGIRIGLLAEIWLDYGLPGAAVAAVIGFLLSTITKVIAYSKTEVGRLLACTLYGIGTLSFVGQTTAITGYLSLIFYLWLLWSFFELFRVKKPEHSLT
jgi:hypothetical protein